MFEFMLKFHLSLFLNVQQQYSSIGPDDGLTPTRRQAIIWTNDGLVYWRIYAPLGLNELIKPCRKLNITHFAMRGMITVSEDKYS